MKTATSSKSPREKRARGPGLNPDQREVRAKEVGSRTAVRRPSQKLRRTRRSGRAEKKNQKCTRCDIAMSERVFVPHPTAPASKSFDHTRGPPNRIYTPPPKTVKFKKVLAAHDSCGRSLCRWTARSGLPFMASPVKAQKDRAIAIYAELQTFLYQVWTSRQAHFSRAALDESP